MTVFVYQDYVHNNGILFRRLTEYCGAGNVLYCDADDIKGGILDTAALFIMPGGADLYHCEKLNGAGNRAIRAFVENGGTYLGICGGAYYACANIEWGKNTTQPICGPRELAFFDGTAIGPVYDFIEDGDIEKSWVAAAALDFDGTICPVFYEGGPVFEGGNATVLARYTALTGTPAAIIECAVGKGKALLCSPHLEYDRTAAEKTLYKHRNNAFTWERETIKKLHGHDAALNKIWQQLLNRVQKINVRNTKAA